jgi:hypothetical protein
MIDLGRTMVVGGGLILAAWLLPSATSDQAQPAGRAQPAAPGPAQRAAAVQDALVLDVEAATARLRTYDTSRPGARRPARNPFRFGPSPAPAVPATGFPPPSDAGAPAGASEVHAPGEAMRQPPALRLVGVAERHGGDPARIAILASSSDVHLAAPGDLVIGRYTVLAVLPDAAELRDETTGAVVRFVLPPQ